MKQFVAIKTADSPPPLTGLVPDGSGQRLWLSIVESYALRPDELRLLADACHLADRIDARETRAADLNTRVGSEFLIRGSTGQRVKNPLIDEARQELSEQRKDRIALNDLLVRLKLPDAEPPDGKPGSSQTSDDKPASKRSA